MRWSEEATLQFVKLYLKHECLWNPPNLGYKSNQLRDKAYSDIISEFKPIKSLTVPEVRLKIRTLRTTYIQQLNKIQLISSPGCIYEPSLVWFNEMDKRLRHIIRAKRQSSETQSTDGDSSSCIWMNVDHDDPDNNYLPGQLDLNSDDIDTFSNPEALTPTKIEKSYSPTRGKAKKKKKFKHKNLPIAKSDKYHFLERKRYDQFDIYGKYIASQLRELDLKKALKLKLQIHSLISEARMLEC